MATAGGGRRMARPSGVLVRSALARTKSRSATPSIGVIGEWGTVASPSTAETSSTVCLLVTAPINACRSSCSRRRDSLVRKRSSSSAANIAVLTKRAHCASLPIAT